MLEQIETNTGSWMNNAPFAKEEKFEIPEQERRQLERIDVNLDSKILFFDTESHGDIDTISLSGVGLFCNRRFKSGTELDIDLNVPGHQVMHLDGRVIWVDESVFESEKGYKYGIELLLWPPHYAQFIQKLFQARPLDGVNRELAKAGLKWWYRRPN